MWSTPNVAIRAGSAQSDKRTAGFPPVAGRDARVLILGSLPSERSIAAGQYYAHPRNAFWPIMAAVTGAKGSYAQRIAALLRHKIALWDVLQSSERPGSLDANIRLSTCQVNDFAEFLARHEALQLICFNGQQAAKIFSSRVSPALPGGEIESLTLPSTSPAHAAMRMEEKQQCWQRALDRVLL